MRGMTAVSAHILPIVHHQMPRTKSAAGMRSVFAAAPRPSVTTDAPAMVPRMAPDSRTGRCSTWSDAMIGSSRP